MKTTTPAKLNVLKLIRLFFLMFAVLSVTQNFAQSKNAQIDLELQQLVRKKQLSEDQAKNYVITAQHTSSTSGIEHIYFNQTLNGLRIIGTESSIHLYNGKKLKFNENLISGRALSTAGSSSPSISAENAIRAIARNMGYRTSNLQEKERIGGVNQETIFNTGGISKKDIPAKLAYQINENNEVELAWEISIEDINSSEDWWVFAVNAASGSIINKYNLFNNCNILDEHNDLFHSGVPSKLNSETTEKIDFSAYLKVAAPAEENAVAASYNVYAMPDESPHHGSTARQVVTGIEGTGSPFGWHDTNGSAGAEFTVTTGNNVDSRKGTIRADGGASLTFNTPHDLTMEPTTADNVLSATVNLFYWNNIIHDLLWEYGFNEASGNFQENNYGNGGLGSDSVNANAQAAGNCNANFGTPSDGSNPTMNMFNCNIATPSRDGDFDNGVIVHEYAHGISNRLTGGAATASCLNNSEQMGEGWSDFYGLIMTIESGDAGTDARGIGTWLLGTGPNGPGVRTERYSTDMSIYTKTYANLPSAVIPHGVGEIWAEMLWEMTWGLIADHGVDANIYNFTGDVSLDKGNVMALALVTEGLKLQPCSPGFVDGRDAILAADVALYGGANACTIWEAFAKRGLGFSADQGSTSSRSDGTAAFDLPPSLGSLDTIDTICESQGTQTGLSGGSPAGGTYSGSGVTDNGDGTFDFDPTVGGTGDTIVTYTVVNPCNGLTENIEDTIVVTDGIPDLVCQNTTVTLDSNGNASITQSDVIANLAPVNLTTSFTANNSQAGNMFDIMAVKNTTINSFDINMNNGVTADVEVYFKTGSWVGSETTPSDWTLMATVPAVTSAGLDQPTPLDLSLGIDVLTGNTVAFYVTLVSTTQFIGYINGSSVGSEWASDTNLVIYEGAGKVYPFGTTFQPRNFSGNIVYTSQELADNCGNPVAINLSQSTFTCDDIGDVTVTVTVDDGAGGTNTCDAIVTVVGTTIIGGFDPCAAPLFITKWEVLAGETITIPTKGRGYKYDVDWSYNPSDGFNAEESNVRGNITSPVLTAGEHTVAIMGDFPRIFFDNRGDKDKITEIVRWGTNRWTTMDRAFAGCSNLDITDPAAGAPNLSLVTNMTRMFNKATTFNGDIGNWDVSNVTNMSYLFALAKAFNQDLNNWDVSNVTNMREMFNQAHAFNGSVDWDVSNVEDMAGMFLHTGAFNQDISNWNTSSVTNMYRMLADARAFDQNLGAWDIGNVTNMEIMLFYSELSTSNYDNTLIGWATDSSGIPGDGIDDIPTNITFDGGRSIYCNGKDARALLINSLPTPTGYGWTITDGGGCPAPVNDLCSDAIMVACGSSTLGTTINATFDAGVVACISSTTSEPSGGNSNITAPGVWYKFIATTSLTVLSTCSQANYDTKISVFDGSCGALTCIGSNDDGEGCADFTSELPVATTPGLTYYVLIHGFSAQTGDFTLDVTCEVFNSFNQWVTPGGETITIPTKGYGYNDNVDLVSLYPNPTESLVTIVSLQTIVSSATVFDIRGRKVFEVDFRNKTSYQIDLSDMEAAVYFIEIATENGTVMKRVMKR